LRTKDILGIKKLSAFAENKSKYEFTEKEWFLEDITFELIV